MRRAERLFRLVNEMRARGVTRAEDLARHFEVSDRTIYRDIAHLQASGLPIEGAAGVGYLLRPGFDLPNMTFTYDQLDALAIGLSFVENSGDGPLADAAREVRSKIQASLPHSESRQLIDAPYFAMRRQNVGGAFSETLRKAIREQRVVDMDYQDASRKASFRRVRPLAFWTFSKGWMFAAWCELRLDFRVFRIDRIVNLHLTDERFQAGDGQDLRAFIQSEAACGIKT